MDFDRRHAFCLSTAVFECVLQYLLTVFSDLIRELLSHVVVVAFDFVFHFVSLSSRMLRRGMQTLRFIDTHAHVHLTLERMKLDGFQSYRKEFFPPQRKGGENKETDELEEEHELEAIVNVYCETNELLEEGSDHSLLDEWDQLYASFGLHPHNAKVITFINQLVLFNAISEHFSHLLSTFNFYLPC